MSDKQTIYCLTVKYARASLKVRQAAIDNWDQEFFNAAIEEQEAAWKELHGAVIFPGCTDPAAVLDRATFPEDPVQLKEEVALVTWQLSMLQAVIAEWPRSVEAATKKEINRYPGDSTNEQVAEAIEAEQLDAQAGPMTIAAAMVSAELEKRGRPIYRVCVEDKGTKGKLNPAVNTLAAEQAMEAFSSDGVAVFITGTSDDEEGIRVFGPYPGATTAALLHRGQKGRAIALEPTGQFEARDLIHPTVGQVDPDACEFGWVNVYGAYNLEEHGIVDGPWISKAAAEKNVDHDAEVVTAPILGPIQLRP